MELRDLTEALDRVIERVEHAGEVTREAAAKYPGGINADTAIAYTNKVVTSALQDLVAQLREVDE